MDVTMKDMTQSRPKRRDGFSLVEVNLALLIIGLGMLVLFGLFPVSLRQGGDAFRDTQAAMFAEWMLNGMRGDMLGVEDLGVWSNQLASVAGQAGTILRTEFPQGSKREIRYLVEMQPIDQRRWGVNLWVWGEAYGPKNVSLFKRRAEWFYSEFYYEGLTDE